MTTDSNNNPWAWLGLLKWSLAYSDGTQPTEVTELTAEDKAFLEAVMKEGIIDENERMKEILKQVTAQIEMWKNESATQDSEDQVEELLQELRDICEQIDYARAFSAMKGEPFLIGCIQETTDIPLSTREMCLGLISTLCQHNPPLQKELLELGSLKTLSELFFAAINDQESSSYQARLMQAISAIVRSHELAEAVFCELEQAPQIVLDAIQGDASTALRKRALFFLRALITSDSATAERVRKFSASIVTAIDSILLMDPEPRDDELVEMTLALIVQILEQAKSVDCILSRRDPLAATSVARIAALRKLTGEKQEYALVELGLWEELLSLLARAVSDDMNPLRAHGTGLIEAENVETLAQ